MVTLNTQRMGMGRRSLFLLGCLVVSVALVRVAAFHSNKFAVPTKALNCESRIDGCIAGRCSTYSCLSQEKVRANGVHLSGLSMARSPGSKPEKGSKRKRFKESIKKVLSYPKVSSCDCRFILLYQDSMSHCCAAMLICICRTY